MPNLRISVRFNMRLSSIRNIQSSICTSYTLPSTGCCRVYCQWKALPRAWPVASPTTSSARPVYWPSGPRVSVHTRRWVVPSE